MKNIIKEYRDALEKFIRGTASADQLQSEFLQKFKVEQRELSEELFQILDRVFGDLDAFTRDEFLLFSRPEYYLNEEQLRQRVELAMRDLGSMLKLE